jgi:hypothetical protein
VNWELPKAVVDWAQVLGAGLSLVALIVALIALYLERRNATAERRNQHELQILRDISNLLTVQEVDRRALITNLRTLSSSIDFPATRTALGVDVTREDEDEFKRLFSERLALKTASPKRSEKLVLVCIDNMAEWQFVLAGEGDSCLLRQELNDAIKRRTLNGKGRSHRRQAR